jgi:hypothetical protein
LITTGYAKLSGDLLVLTVDNDRYFLILNADTLEKLDMNKQRVDTQSGMHLKRKTDGE